MFPFSIKDKQTLFFGSFLIKRIQKPYHPNYDYFQVDFPQAVFHLQDRHNTNIYKRKIEGLVTALCVKKEYKKTKNSETCFIQETEKPKDNHYDLLVVNCDVNNILGDNPILRGMLNARITCLFLENEYILTRI
ncbi:hypothetical protein [Peribacillus muralis]|uniref:hypothetical protein n=1 Tax=Peribacillus muralis TaxID=264697 RepID=UPI003CFD483A